MTHTHLKIYHFQIFKKIYINSIKNIQIYLNFNLVKPIKHDNINFVNIQGLTNLKNNNQIVGFDNYISAYNFIYLPSFKKTHIKHVLINANTLFKKKILKNES